MRKEIQLFTFDLSDTSNNERNDDYNLLLENVEDGLYFNSNIKNVFILCDSKINSIINKVSIHKEDRFVLFSINNYDDFISCITFTRNFIVLSFDLYNSEKRDYEEIDKFISKYNSMKITKNVWIIKIENASIFNIKELFQKEDKVYFSYINYNFDAYPSKVDVEIEDFMNINDD